MEGQNDPRRSSQVTHLLFICVFLVFIHVCCMCASSVAKTWPSDMKPTTTANLGKLGLYTQNAVPLLRLEKMAQEAKIESLGLGIAKELQAHMELKTKVE